MNVRDYIILELFDNAIRLRPYKDITSFEMYNITFLEELRVLERQGYVQVLDGVVSLNIPETELSDLLCYTENGLLELIDELN